jgi:protein-S-isoprenylcysteine O-methyltransferase Ste14
MGSNLSQPEIPQDKDSRFDPSIGCQNPSTGIAGALFMLALVAVYALFKTYALKNGGPPVADCLAFFPKSARFATINREYFDIMGVVFTGFLFMVTWEFSRDRAERRPVLGMCLSGVAAAAIALERGARHADAQTFRRLGWDWTSFEAALALVCAGLCAVWVLRLATRYTPRPVQPALRALKAGSARWAAGLLFFTLIMVIFITHPFYRDGYYENWRITVSYLYLAYLTAGLPYAFVTNWLRKSVGEDRRDPGFMILLIARAALRRARGGGAKRFSMVARNRATLAALRDLGVKFFFVPLMVTFLFVECGEFFQNFPPLLRSVADFYANPSSFFEGAFTPGKPNRVSGMFNQFYFSAFHGIFVMDVGLSLVGYICTSRWLHNKSKSVDPSLSGWLVALICYPPFNGVTTGYMPYSRSFGDMPYLAFTQYGLLGATTALALTDALDVTLKIVTLAAFSVYVWATMAFGLRFSNLTNRGIIARGPYAWIRHPAYVSKNIAWWAENARSFSSLWQIIFLAAWNYIYYLRALTEERHLMRDPDYRAYCEKAPHRFIPGFF